MASKELIQAGKELESILTGRNWFAGIDFEIGNPDREPELLVVLINEPIRMREIGFSLLKEFSGEFKGFPIYQGIKY